MREHFITENGIRDLRRMDEVHLEETGLQMALLGSILLQSIQQEGCCRLDHILRHKDVHDL